MKGQDEKADYSCAVCGDVNAPWGFRKKFYCTAHKEAGEILFQSLSDGHSAAAALPEDKSTEDLGPAQRVML